MVEISDLESDTLKFKIWASYSASSYIKQESYLGQGWGQANKQLKCNAISFKIKPFTVEESYFSLGNEIILYSFKNFSEKYIWVQISALSNVV